MRLQEERRNALIGAGRADANIAVRNHDLLHHGFSKRALVEARNAALAPGQTAEQQAATSSRFNNMTQEYLEYIRGPEYARPGVPIGSRISPQRSLPDYFQRLHTSSGQAISAEDPLLLTLPLLWTITLTRIAQCPPKKSIYAFVWAMKEPSPVKTSAKMYYSGIQMNEMPSVKKPPPAKVVGNTWIVSKCREVSDRECEICFEEFEVGVPMSTLNCFCIFHEACIKDWFEKKKSCPTHSCD
ncbi:hypothetical protein BDR26DRAFT_984877 [Obelidium mucronatum]|nr:hypothetical protein BDR26DRAFT_984877 [Obelidium mucronatum]